MSFLRIRSCAILIAAALAVSGGCVQQPVTNQRPQVTVGNSDGSTTPPENGLTDFDSCAGRLHDIEGEFLEYYRVHQKLPPTLQDLRPIAQSFGDEGNYTCPVSSQPYIYIPNGMVIQGDDRRLILYDAVPVHRVEVRDLTGNPAVKPARWVLLFGSAYGNRPPAAWVVKIPDELLQHYHPAPAPQPASQPAAGQNAAPR